MTDYDLVIIGGGIHGCGIAQAASAAGYRSLVIEKSAIAAGTSSRSSKLIHGGLRYLESFDFSLVKKSISERELLVKLAPDLVKHVPFYIPVYKSSSRGSIKIMLGLSLYALLGKLRAHSCYRKITRDKWPELDNLSQRKLKAVYQYWDAQTDDIALTRAVMYSALDLGAELSCPAEVTQVLYNNEQYETQISMYGENRTVTSNAVVNAAGPWHKEVQDKIIPKVPPFDAELVAGTHVIVRQPSLSGIYYVESPSDRRAIFIMPWYGKTMIGTTEKVFTGDPESIEPTQEEIDYLLSIAGHYFPDMELSVDKSFAGLRVLPSSSKSVFKRPRDTIYFTHAALPGYVAIIGGKLTSYRITAEQAIQKLRDVLPQRERCCNTDEIELKPAPEKL